MADWALFRFLRVFFDSAFFCSRISRVFVISLSKFLVTLSQPSVIDCSPYDCFSTFHCSLLSSNSGSSGFLFVLSCRFSILRYVMETSSIEGCSKNILICDVKYRLIATSWSMETILERSL